MSKLLAARITSLLITLFGTVTNIALGFHVLTAWQQLKWGDVESEWATDNWPQAVDGVKVLWALLSVYFASAASVCAFGLVGTIKSKASLVRFYRDYSIADFAFCSLATLAATYAAFLPSARAAVCEEFSHHPELMRDLHEMGLNSENCEQWISKAIYVVVGVLFTILVIRLHFLLAVSNFYDQLVRQSARCPSHCCSSGTHLQTHSRSGSTSGASQRILLVPISTPVDTNVEMVYTPVPRSSLPRDTQTTAKEMWVSPIEHRYRHHRHRSRETGKIRLPVKPDEPLLPVYHDDDGKV